MFMLALGRGRWAFSHCSQQSYMDMTLIECDNIFVFSKQNGDLAQRAKKIVSDSPGLVDFAIRLVNSVFNLPDGQVILF